MTTGVTWTEIPKKYGGESTIFKRYRSWAKSGVWQKIHQELINNADSQRKATFESVFEISTDAGETHL